MCLACPFVKTDELGKRGRNVLSCERGKLIFNDKESMRIFMAKYCGSLYGWESCSLAGSLIDYYKNREE